MYLRLIGAAALALALMLTSALAFYIARARADLAEMPSPTQVNHTLKRNSNERDMHS